MSLFRAFLLSVLCIIPACRPSVPSPSKNAVDLKGDNTPSSGEAVGVTSDDVLASAMHQLRPENFDLNSATDKPVSLLNSWRFKQAEAKVFVDEAVPVLPPNGWGIGEELPRLAQPKFDANDAEYIRDVLLHRAMSVYLADRGNDDRSKVGEVVAYVCRNIAYWKDDELGIPLSLYLINMIGRGTAEDRAWVIAEVLKQLRIDSIILRPKSDVKGTSDKWLLGVLVDGEVLLYDVRFGVPLPNGEPNKHSSATLATIAAHPEWLEQLSTKTAYPITAQDLQDLEVFVISNPNTWCRRMFNLEQVLSTNDLCVLYDPLVDHEGRIGLLNRIAKSVGRPAETLKLWPYPRQQIVEAGRSSAERDIERRQLTGVLNVPFQIKLDPKGQPGQPIPERKMHRYRTEQILGHFKEATTKYLGIRHLDVEPSPPILERINRMAAEDALYWTTLCKYELKEHATAIDLLLDYIRKYDRKGKWFFPARALLAQCYADLDRIPEAMKTLEKTSSDDPYQDLNALRLKRWSASLGKTK